MTQDKPAKAPREFSDWLIIGAVGACVASIAVIVFFYARDTAREAEALARVGWTDCFDDPAPALVEEQLRLAHEALARLGDGAALAAAERGQEILREARMRRKFEEGFFVDSGVPPPGYVGRAETRLLESQLKHYREQCYPTRLPIWFR